MATNLTTIFGTEIVVSPQARTVERQLSAFAGAHGLTSMFMGSRGYTITVTGRIAADASAGYNAGRAILEGYITAIEAYQYNYAADYTFRGILYENVIFEKFDIKRDANGKAFHYVKGNYLIADFTAQLRALT